MKGGEALARTIEDQFREYACVKQATYPDLGRLFGAMAREQGLYVAENALTPDGKLHSHDRGTKQR